MRLKQSSMRVESEENLLVIVVIKGKPPPLSFTHKKSHRQELNTKSFFSVEIDLRRRGSNPFGCRDTFSSPFSYEGKPSPFSRDRLS